MTLGHALHQLLPNVFPSAEQSSLEPLLHGVVVPLDTPIGWMSQCMVYADNFLHIVIDTKCVN
jgi:autophagy-related protein 5